MKPRNLTIIIATSKCLCGHEQTSTTVCIESHDSGGARHLHVAPPDWHEIGLPRRAERIELAKHTCEKCFIESAAQLAFAFAKERIRFPSMEECGNYRVLGKEGKDSYGSAPLLDLSSHKDEVDGYTLDDLF